MDKWSLITYLAVWGTIILQWLTIRDLKKQLKNEKEWSRYWYNAYRDERNE